MQVVIIFRRYKKRLFAIELQSANQANHFTGFWCFQLNVFYNDDRIRFRLIRQCRDFGKILYFTVELKIITPWFWSEYGSTTFIQWVPDISFTGTAGTFL